MEDSSATALHQTGLDVVDPDMKADHLTKPSRILIGVYRHDAESYEDLQSRFVWVKATVVSLRPSQASLSSTTNWTGRNAMCKSSARATWTGTRTKKDCLSLSCMETAHSRTRCDWAILTTSGISRSICVLWKPRRPGLLHHCLPRLRPRI